MKHVGSLFAVCAVTVFASGQTVLMAQDVVITQNPDCDTDAGSMVACGADGSTAENWFARNFYIDQGVTINSVTWGSGYTTSVSANIFFSIASGAGNPDSVTLTPVGTAVQPIDAGPWYDTPVDTPFDVPAGSYLVVEFQIPDTGVDQGIWPANTATASETTYLKAADCGITAYTDVAAIGFPDSQMIMCVNATLGNFDPCTLPLPTECTADVDGDLVVAVGDVLLIIGNWGVCGDGTFRPIGDISPLPNGDCCVDVSDVLAVIGSWGQDCLPRGACCSNTGGCTDDQLQEDCEASGGMYFGDDSLCSDGECVDGACCIDESTCQDGTVMWVCDVLGGIFRGSGSTCATVSCEAGCNATGCQTPDLKGHGSSGTIGATSDTNPGAGFRVADTFRPTASGAITEICWWGIYIDFGTSTDCGASGPGTGDNFTITYYLDDGDSTVPGTMFAGPFMVSSSVTPTGDVIPSGIGDIVQYGYSASHPPVKVQADACYWISIVNETTADCYWLWQTAPEGDGRSAQDNGGWGTNDFDLGFCVNIDITSDGCGAFVGPCCLADLSCQIMSAGSCATAEGTYGGDNLTCGDVNNCQPIPGACCFDADACLDNLNDAECVAFGGTFAGEDTLCAQGACVPPEPDGCTFQWCDDDTELNIGVGGGTLVWGVPMSFTDCDTLTTVKVQWGTVPDGTAAYIVISQDPNGDGDPTDAIVLSCTPVVVKNSSGEWVSYEITPTDVAAGTVHVSCSMVTTGADYPMGLDNTSGSAENSWTGFGFSDVCDPWSDAGATYGVIDDLAPDLAGNWMIGTPPQQP